MEALVEYDYKAQEIDELTLKKGDIITNVDVRSGGWWEGTLARIGKRGMFPDNFVKLLGDSSGVSQESKTETTQRTSSSKKCKVLFGYKPANEDELELHIGDIIEFLGEEEEGWWKGKLNNHVGVFPSNFVMKIAESSTEVKETSIRKTKLSHEEITKQTGITLESNSHQNIPNSTMSSNNDILSTDAPVLPPKPSKEMCRVLYAYEAANDDELTLQEGDIITLITKDGQDVGWWKGELRGKIGVFPDNFVQVVPAEELQKPDRPAKIVTTNRIRDSITKPVTTSTPVSTGKKFIETQKLEEKVSPPNVSKKPSLPPPPLKKPMKSPTTNDLTKSATSPSLATKLPDSPTSGMSSKLPLTGISAALQSMTQHMSRSTTETSSTSSTSKWMTVVENDNTDGSLWSRQTYSVTSGSSSSSMSMSASSGAVMDLDLDIVGRSAMLTHPTASRAKAPRRRLPTSMPREDSKEDDEAEGLLNGIAEVPVEKPTGLAPWVEELKLNQAKKQASKTRVIIASSLTELSSSNSEQHRLSTATASSTSSSQSLMMSGVNLRPPKLPTSEPPALTTGTVSAVTTSPVSSPGQKPERPLSSLFAASPTQIVAKPLVQTSPSALNTTAITPTPAPNNTVGATPTTEETVTVTVKQWNDVNERISKLESHVEHLTKTVKELTEKLTEETHKRHAMEQELEKITGVTV